ncbi:MAG TPA: universal stress protein [Pirellulales bacterium]|nr:universal stress protein [Pirellulales bacterium]
MNATSFFHKILVPIDFSETASVALAQAVTMAKRLGAAVTVMHVIPQVEGSAAFSPGPDAIMAAWQPSEGVAEIEEQLQATAEQHLREAVEPYRGQGVEISCQTLWGTPFIEIIHAVLEEGHDLVMVGTRGRSAISRMLVGSTSSKLVRKCPCPVWVVKPEAKSTLDAILAPIDFSDVGHESLRLAAALAAQFHAELHVLHVFAPEHSYYLDFMPEDDLDLARQRGRHESVARLQTFVKESALPVEPALHAEWGEVVPRTLATAEQIDAGLIVMGTLGRAGVAGLLIGNTAENILHTSQRPLLAVKPLGYVSPVVPRFAAVEV